VAIKQEIHDTIINATPEGGIEFMHGYTYSGHPVACAAANATLALYEKEKLFERAGKMAPAFEAAAHALKGTRHVIDIRNYGLVAGIEMESRAGAPGKRGYEALVRCFEKGVLVRTTGDIVAVSPPLVVDEKQIERIFSTIAEVIKSID